MCLKYGYNILLILCILFMISSTKSNNSFTQSICPAQVIKDIEAPSVGLYHSVKQNEPILKKVVRFALKKIAGPDMYPFIVFDIKYAASKIGKGTSYSVEFVFKYDILTNGVRCCVIVKNHVRTGWKKLEKYECRKNHSKKKA